MGAARAQRRPASTSASPRRKATSTFGSRTDVGCLREHNEDSLVVAPPLFAVADGMGGHAAGEVASEIAVNVLADQAPNHADATALGEAVVAANRAVIRGVREGVGREGMGTTCTAAILEGERLVIAQVGDSRAYLLHQGKLQQITRDHSLMADMIESGQLTPEEARVHPQRSVITRALGSDPHLQPDLYEINVETGDRLLLCSDGLSTMLRDKNIEDVMNKVSDPQRCASQLVSAAVTAGGYDNVTVIVANVEGFAKARQKKTARKTKVTVALVLALLAAIVGGAAYAFSYWTENAAYLTELDGVVAIYRGVPGNILGMTFSQLETKTDIQVDDLQPGLANRLREGAITADNMESAEALAESYRQDIAAQNGAGQEDSLSQDESEPAEGGAANSPEDGAGNTQNTQDAQDAQSAHDEQGGTPS